MTFYDRRSSERRQPAMMTNPFALFSNWYTEAQNGALVNPDVVALASATREGRPSVRMVFYRGIREGGFSFFTNYESRKGRELAENPFAAMVFHWAHLGKQVRIEGPVERLSSKESDLYFHQRPLQSRVTAAVSRQSHPMFDESAFLAEIRKLEQAAETTPVARPLDWGGFKLMPSRYEFWIHSDHRRHHRTLYEKDGVVWKESRLYP